MLDLILAACRMVFWKAHRFHGIKDRVPEVASSIFCFCESKCRFPHVLAHLLLGVHDLLQDLTEPAQRLL